MNLISHEKKKRVSPLRFVWCEKLSYIQHRHLRYEWYEWYEWNKQTSAQSIFDKTPVKDSFEKLHVHTPTHTHTYLKHSFDHFTQRIYNYSIMYFSKMNCNELWPTPCCVINLSLWSHAHPSPSYWRSGNIIVLFSFLFQLWYCKSINLHCNDANDTVRDMSVWENSTHDVKK